jgi:hypothetical protein
MAPAPKEVPTVASKPGGAAEPIEITLSNGCRLRIGQFWCAMRPALVWLAM